MPLSAGTRIGVYEVTEVLGIGGMGEVYRARDTRLGRDVALKVLPDLFAADPERLARFEREAQVLASLNHPHIAQIYGIEDGPAKAGPYGPNVGADFSRPVRALVMELVEGETLAERIARGPIPADEALPLAREIAEALEAAHELGIIHRDLKPANIKITPSGSVKVLDFGLARLVESPVARPLTGREADREGPPHLSMSPTMMSPAMTGVGSLLGTAAYMPPEQARGRIADRRADVWAFGVVLFESLTGSPLFTGETTSDVLAAVLRAEPGMDVLPADTPVRIRDLLRRCLQKDVRQRLRDMGDARLEIEEAMRAPAGKDDAPSASGAATTRRALIAAVAVLVLALVALAVPAVRHLQEQPIQQPEVRFDVPAAALVRADAASFALSPDGRALVFAGPGERQLWLRTMDSPVAQSIDGAGDARSPVWAPDSRSIAFANVSNGALRRMSLDGGAPITIATVRPFRGMSWGAGDVLLVASAAGIVRMPASGGDLTTVIPAAEGLIYSNPVFLPDGRTFLYLSSRGGQGGGAQEQTAWIASLDAPAGKRLFDTGTKVEYVAPGYLLAGDGASLFAYPFDIDRLEVTGDRFAVVQGASLFSASASGAVAYRPPAAEGSFQLAWVDRTGQQVAPLGPPMTTANEVDLAPDGRYAATVRATNDNFDIWLVEVARGVMTRLTATPTLTRWPVWSPDSRRVAYADGNNLVVTDADGAGTPETLLEDPLSKYSSDWSPDGTLLLYAVQTRSPARSDLWVLPLTGDREPFPFSATGADETRGQFAPDGRWVSYDADDSGRLEVYVRPFQRTGRRVQISVDGGIGARWHPGGREIFYIGPKGDLMSVAVRPSADGLSLDVATPRTLFPLGTASGGGYPPTFKMDYDVSADGERFLVLQTTDAAATSAITVIANWQPQPR